MNRGAARQPIFRTADAAVRFLDLLGEASERSGVEVHAYCLMGNHFHLLVRNSIGQLSAGMQRLSSVYTRWFNQRVGRDGPLFRSRFLAPVVDTDSYLMTVGRYIHRNPLDRHPQPVLDRYRWSSYQYYVTTRTAPEWLCTDALLADDADIAEMRAFVEGESCRSLFIGELEWAIRTSMYECAELCAGGTQNMTRTIALGMLDEMQSGGSEQIERWLAFPNRDALYSARYRARRRLESDAALVTTVRSAIAKLTI